MSAEHTRLQAWQALAQRNEESALKIAGIGVAAEYRMGFASTVPIVAALLLNTCGSGECPNGEAKRLCFELPGSGGYIAPLASDGASIRMQVSGIDDPVILASSDPSIAAITPDGTITTGAPGIARIIASTEAEGEVDRTAVEVVRATHIEIGSASYLHVARLTVLFPGYEHRLALFRSHNGGLLAGTGGYLSSSDGVLSVREGEPLVGFPDVVVVSGTTPGAGAVTVRSGDATASREFRIAAVEEIDRIESGFCAPNPESAFTRMQFVAFAGTEHVAGARCEWELVGATLHAEWADPDCGAWVADFVPAGEQFSVTCIIGAVRATYQVSI